MLPVETATFLPIVQYVNPVVMSKEKFDSLPSDLQQVLTKAGKDLEQYTYDYVVDRYSKIYNTLESKGVQFHTPTKEELAEWKKALLPVWNESVESIKGGKDLIGDYKLK